MLAIEEILGRLQGVTSEGKGHWKALCPLHDDHNPSMSITDKGDGHLLFNCFSCGGRGALDLQTGKCSSVELAEALRLDTPSAKGAAASKDAAQGCTPEEYSRAKRLPLDFLRDAFGIGAGDLKGTPITLFPYKTRDGRKTGAVRWRRALRKKAGGDGRFMWPKGARPFLYGLWLQEPPTDWIIIVEGESDTQTLVYNQYPALGLPGSNFAKLLDGDELAQYKNIAVCIEPDTGGRELFDGLKESAILQRARFFTLKGQGYKDASEAWCKLNGDRAAFKAVMDRALAEAVPYGQFDQGALPEAKAAKKGGGQTEAWGNRQGEHSAENGQKGGSKGVLGGRPKADYYGFALAYLGRMRADGQDFVWRDETWYAYTGKFYREYSDKAFCCMVERELQARAEEVAAHHFEGSANAAREVAFALAAECMAVFPAADNLRILEPDGTPFSCRTGAYEPDVVAFDNGLLHLADGRLEPLTPRFFNTSALPYDYLPDADAPTFRRFIGEIMPDADTRRVLQNMAGYCLGRGRGAQRIFVLQGMGRNGKGVFLKILAAAIGREKVASLGLEGMGERFNSIQLAERQVNICEEITVSRDDSRMPAYIDMLKNISGGGFVHCEKKGKTPTRGEARAQLIFASNKFPYFGDMSDGLRRRLVFIPFTQSFKGREDSTLAERIIAEEMPGVLNWMLEGYRRCAEAARTPGGWDAVFSSAETAEEAARYWEKANPLETLLKDLLEPDARQAIDHAALYALVREELARQGMRGRSSITMEDAIWQVFGIRKTRPREYGQKRVYMGLSCRIQHTAGGDNINLRNEFQMGADVPF